MLRRIFYISVGIFCVSVVVSLSLIVFRLVLKNSFDSLDRQEQQLNSQLLSQQDKKDKLLETKSRIIEIKNVLAKRSPMTARIDAIALVVPPDSQIDALNGGDSDMQLTLESESLASLNDLIEKKATEVASDKKRGIKKIEMRSFGLSPKTHKYTISIGITFI